VGNEGAGGDGGGAWPGSGRTAQVREERWAGEAEGDLHGCAVAQFADGGGGSGYGARHAAEM
jgi:hypothetical protein